MSRTFKAPPTYAITSVDNALRIAAMLQLEGDLTVSEVGRRLGVATSTAHRLLQMLVYRDFAVQNPDRTYGAGPILELAAHSESATARLRAAALPHLTRLVEVFDESVNLTVRTGNRVRFVASAESTQALRVGSREGMVFPAHLTSGGLVLLADLDPAEVAGLYVGADGSDSDLSPDLADLAETLAAVRRSGFAVNDGKSERGVLAVGVAVRDGSGTAVAALAVSMPSVRYSSARLREFVQQLRVSAERVQRDLAGGVA